MKKDIHPDYVDCTVTCTCGNTFQTRSTKPEIRVDICSACHPFFTGTQKLIDSGGRVQRFADKFGAARETVAAREAAKKAEREAKAAAKAQRAAEYAKKAEEEAAKATDEAVAGETAESDLAAEMAAEETTNEAVEAIQDAEAAEAAAE